MIGSNPILAHFSAGPCLILSKTVAGLRLALLGISVGPSPKNGNETWKNNPLPIPLILATPTGREEGETLNSMFNFNIPVPKICLSPADKMPPNDTLA